MNLFELKFGSKFWLTVGLTGLGLAAYGQSINSFVYVDSISGVTTSLSGLNLATTLGSTPTFTWNSSTYQIERLWGVWALDDDDDLNGTSPDNGIWKSNTNFAGYGGIIGWKTQTPNSGLTASQSKTLAFGNLNGTIEGIGYHVRVLGALPGGGNTLHIRQSPVPEPATLVTVGLGIGTLMRRRKRRER